MYVLELVCRPEAADLISAELWDAGTIAIREIDRHDRVALIAGFESNEHRAELLDRLAEFSPKWQAADVVDWVAVTRNSWRTRSIGEKLFLAPVWSEEPTPPGRLRLIHNPGLACGTGEHPCTQLALTALEKVVAPGCRLVDIGTGSGILAIAGLRLGAKQAIGIDTDCAALKAARENLELNGLAAQLVCGSAGCIGTEWADATVANISGTVLLAIWDELLRITRRPGRLLITGFPVEEAQAFQSLLPESQITTTGGWACLSASI